MKRTLVFFLTICSFLSFSQDNRTKYFPKATELVKNVPDKNNVWVFILAGQSNMAGRGLVEPQDTVPDKRIMSINSKGQLILAKEPIHFQEPLNAGLDCGFAFARTMIENIPGKINILIIPAAIGGSSISQWLGDSLFRNVHLLSNFREKMEIGKKYGIVKAVLWHQGEGDATPQKIPLYKERLKILFKEFRSSAGNSSLSILIGELGPFKYNNEGFLKINAVIREYSADDKYSAVIPTSDLKDKGDSLHFNSESQRLMGKRFALEYLRKFK